MAAWGQVPPWGLHQTVTRSLEPRLSCRSEKHLLPSREP